MTRVITRSVDCFLHILSVLFLFNLKLLYLREVGSGDDAYLFVAALVTTILTFQLYEIRSSFLALSWQGGII